MLDRLRRSGVSRPNAPGTANSEQVRVTGAKFSRYFNTFSLVKRFVSCDGLAE